MRVEILCTGDEILTGKTVNTNYTYISRRLVEVGLEPYWGSTVGDDREALLTAFRQAAVRAPAVIVDIGKLKDLSYIREDGDQIRIGALTRHRDIEINDRKALSDLIEGVPPSFMLGWLPGYFINPACFWVAYQLFGRCPDFRRASTWGRYALFVALFLSIEPVLWGYICSDRFTPRLSYGQVTTALLLTTSITWLLAPPAMLLAARITTGTRMVPTGSMWRIGLKLMRPCACAVMSPK